MENLIRLLPDKKNIIRDIYDKSPLVDRVIRGALVRILNLIHDNPDIDYINLSKGGNKASFEKRKLSKLRDLENSLKQQRKRVEETEQDLLDVCAQVYDDEVPFVQLPEIIPEEEEVKIMRNEIVRLQDELRRINVEQTRMNDIKMMDDAHDSFEFRLKSQIKMIDQMDKVDQISELKLKLKALKKFAIEQSERWWHEYHLIFSSLKIMHEKEDLPFNMKETIFDISQLRNYDIE